MKNELDKSILALLNEREKDVNSIVKLMDADTCTLTYKYFYKPFLILRDDLGTAITSGTTDLTKDIFNKAIIDEVIVKRKLINKALDIVNNFERDISDEKEIVNKNINKNRGKNEIKNSLNPFELKLCEYIGQVYITFNKKLDDAKLLEIFKYILEKSNLFYICLSIQNGTYLGYSNFLEENKK